MSGHIRRRSSTTWEIKFDTDADPTGRRVTRYVSVKGTKKQAQARLIELLGEAQRGALTDPSKETLAAFLTRWSRDWAAHNVSPKTAERWSELIANQIISRLGGMPIQRLRASHFAEFYATLAREGAVNGGPLSARTVGHAHRLLRRALGHATTWGLLPQNPVVTVHPPRLAETEITIPDERELAAALVYVKERDRQLHAFAILALTSGARRGELCALRWSDLDPSIGMLRIERALESTTQTGLRIKAPKTKYGRRTISIPASAIDELRAHWKRQQEQRLAIGLGRGSPDDLIFATPDGALVRPDTMSDRWLRATTAAVGRSITLHSLRHHHASSLIAAGVDVLAISRRLGHASPTITLSVYGHLYPNADDKASQATELMFARVMRLSTTKDEDAHRD
jgi:integrase